MHTSDRLATLAAAILAAVVIAGCGSDEPEAPASVSDADVQEDGAFWLSLDDDLQRELAGICQGDQVEVESDPQQVLYLQDLDTDDYVAEINAYFEDGDETETIESVCEQATAEIASDNFGELAPALQQGE